MTSSFEIDIHITKYYDGTMLMGAQCRDGGTRSTKVYGHNLPDLSQLFEDIEAALERGVFPDGKDLQAPTWDGP